MMLFNTNIAPHLVQEKIIDSEDEQKINAAVTKIQKARIVLPIVSSALKNGYTNSFYKMLKIMKNHGNDDTKQLCADIECAITELDGKEGMIEFNCKDF